MKPTANIKSYALKVLAVRDRSEHELRTKLKDKGYDGDLIDKTVIELKNAGLIDDRKTAESLLHYGRQTRFLGEIGVRHYLKTRGIDDDIIGHISISADQQMETAKKLIEKREKYLKKLPLKVKINRLYGQLQRKGYGYELINRVMREYEALAKDPTLEKSLEMDNMR